MPPRFSLFAVAAPGLSAVLAGELAALGLPGIAEHGGVSFEGDRDALYRANLWLRTATRILVRVGTASARDFARLRKRVAALPWEDFPRDPTVTVAATAHHCRLYHTGGIAERITGAVADRLGAPRPGGPALHLVVRGEDDVFTISVDSSGELLHRRGYRTEDSGAPLRETLAAGLLLLCAWDGTRPLVDPTCGSGTIPIEAALIAGGRAPGVLRRFACEDWPGTDGPRMQALRAEAKGSTPLVAIAGSDIDPEAVAAAGRNAERAEISGWLRWDTIEAARLALPPGPGLVLANPPYGQRIRASGDLYRRLGRLAREAGWELALVTSDERLAAQAGKPRSRVPLINGGTRVGLYRY